MVPNSHTAPEPDDTALKDDKRREGAEDAATTEDVLAPWGSAGPPEPGSWQEDVLGKPFECRILPLLPDDEGETCAALVRQRVASPAFVLLYLHGRNDYFFQTELADAITSSGGAFYALDLRKYGRALRPWQTIGYADDLRIYDEDISEALEVIRKEHGGLPLILMGHSTGGLIATLWAYRHPGVASGLILNSGWLELQKHAGARPALSRTLDGVASIQPRATIIGAGPDSYSRSLIGGWSASGFELPAELEQTPDDPAVRGWDYAHEWKRPDSYPVPAAWIRAILDGHAEIEKNVFLEIPVLSATSTKSGEITDWSEEVFSRDIVLDVDLIQKRAAKLSNCVTLLRLPGKHDLTASDPAVREAFYEAIRRWLSAIL